MRQLKDCKFATTSLRCRLAAAAFVFVSLPSLAAEVRVLTGEQGTSQTGQWAAATGASQRLEGRPGLYASSGSGATYAFNPNLPETGDYAVEVFNNCYSPRAHNVAHVIRHAGGTTLHTLEQDCAPDPLNPGHSLDPFVGTWRPLGIYRFNAGTGGGLTVDTNGSNNVYVGATGVRFIYTPASGGSNTVPVITPSTTSVTVAEGSSVSLTAVAFDQEDGEVTSLITWVSPLGGGEGGAFFVNAGSESFSITATVTDSQGAVSSAVVQVNVTPAEQPPTQGQFFGFDSSCGAGLSPLVGFTTQKPTALPQVGMRCGTYAADLLSNANDITLHFNQQQGRFDGVQASFPFVAIARGVGIAPIGQPTQPHTIPGDGYMFAGVQIHHSDLENRNSAHVVVGQRGAMRNTIEGKQTRNGSSQQDDVGNQVVPSGRADIRIVGNADRTLTVYWQPHVPGAPDAWIPYEGHRAGRPPGVLRGDTPEWGNSIYIGLITYAFGTAGVPFMGLVDSFEVIQN